MTLAELSLSRTLRWLSKDFGQLTQSIFDPLFAMFTPSPHKNAHRTQRETCQH